MRLFWNAPVAAPLIGALWTVVVAVTLAILLSFATGGAYIPTIWGALALGAVAGFGTLYAGWTVVAGAVAVAAILMGAIGFAPIQPANETGLVARVLVALLSALCIAWPLGRFLHDMPHGKLTRHEFEHAAIRALTAFGYIFFTVIVLVPFYVMVLTSFKTTAEMRANPLDFSIDFSRGWDLFSAYVELFQDFNFGIYLFNSFFISIMTVILTLLFSVPGAYAVARLRFQGQAVFSRSILLIYMVPLIVLALPIYIAFSVSGLRNTIIGILLIYPVTTIPVALYMLQGYFRGLPAEVEEAGLMDGLTRLQVIWKITLPLSLPALASVALYVFMIAWNEFLLVLMLLDDPGKFTLPLGIRSLNNSEVDRENLMAGAVIATVPIMLIFLGLERFMTKGLTAGSVKG